MMMLKVKHLSDKIIILLLFISTFLFSGCAYNVAVKRDKPISFQEREEKLQLNVGLYLSDEVKKHIIKAKGPIGGGYNFLIGEALEANAIESLKKIFHEVFVIRDKTNISPYIERIISIEISPASHFVLGATTLSKKTSKVELSCEIYDNKWNLLWKGSSIGKVNRTTGGAGVTPALIGIFGVAIQQRALGDIVDESLVLALEQLNEKILTDGRKQIME